MQRSRLTSRACKPLVIHSFIPEFLRRPFRKYSQRRPQPTTAIQINLKQPAKRTFITLVRRWISKGSPFQVEGPPMENARRCLVVVLARGTNSWPVAEEQRARHPGRPNTYRAHKGNLGHYQETTTIPKQLSYKKCAEQM